jgi:hypothetical protein
MQQRIVLTRKDIFVPNFFLYTVNVVVLLVWTLTSPQQWTRVPVNGQDSSLNLAEGSTYGWCGSDETRMFLGIILGTNFVVMIVSLIQAYECRKITTEYSDSLWVSASIAVIAQIWIVGLPILKLLEREPRGVFLTKVGFIFASTNLTLALIFGPKIGHLYSSLEGEDGDDIGYSKHHHHHHHDSETQSHSEDDEIRSRAGSRYGTEEELQYIVRSERLPPLGIRIIPASYIHSEQADKLQMEVDKAEKRNRSLQLTLENLQEKMEQFIVARDPLGTSPSALGRGPIGQNVASSPRAKQY